MASPAPSFPDRFLDRHLGPSDSEQAEMLAAIGYGSTAELIAATVPPAIRRDGLDLPPAQPEHLAQATLRGLAGRNRVRRAFIGMGYHNCVVPPVIRRNVLENPGWYTQYTPYQAEISQGRLEGLLTFQTLVSDLTGLEIANASLLDEATAAAEAMHVCLGQATGRDTMIVHAGVHPQTLDVLRTRAAPLGVRVLVTDQPQCDERTAGVLFSYPATDGTIHDWRAAIAAVHAAGALAVVVTDLLACCVLASPASLGADIAIGSAQRFGVPFGFGGPHAAFFATTATLRRSMPGRLVGISKDRLGNPALRLALQTREQHIRREKATSNICTAQALLANMAAFYAMWHGPEGLSALANLAHAQAAALAGGLKAAGFALAGEAFFDTVTVITGSRTDALVAAAAEQGFLLRRTSDERIGIALDETVTDAEIDALLAVFGAARATPVGAIPAALARQGSFLSHPIFHRHRTEHEMLRLLKRLENKDFSLTHGMIPLGSCTMKLNAASQMEPVTWHELADIHPFAPAADTAGWKQVFTDLERWLGEITGLPGVSLQPNAGSQGEYAGLLAIQAWHRSRGEGYRNVCLIPVSAHGTNPASAVMAGQTVVAVACDALGNIDIADLTAKAQAHRDRLSCLMVTYPSTHGVFEAGIREITTIIHAHGGQVYMDGANMNAQVGLTSPGSIGADVCHLNLHKTFCIPHGGGGPGMGPICVASHLIPFLPGHAVVSPNGIKHTAVSAAPWGSAGILVIPWMYIATMGGEGLRRATEVAILNANYIAARLKGRYPVLYSGSNGTVAHECILDLRPFKAVAGIEAEDVAKRLMDYGFHAPTLSFPVPGTLMVEPTESESKAELDRFIDAMIHIHDEILAVAEGRLDRSDNPLKNAPHTEAEICADHWQHHYPRSQAAFPVPSLKGRKFWPAVARVDNAWGDRNLMCSCAGMESYR